MLRDVDVPRLTPDRRSFIKQLCAGTIIVAFGGGLYEVLGDSDNRKARAQTRSDGRARLPPGQSIIKALRPMGGTPGDPSPGAFKLHVHGEVKKELWIDFAQLLALPQIEQESDVHCVTTWSVLGAHWKGVRISHLADLAGVTDKAKHVIFEAAGGYTANVRLSEAMAPDVLAAHQLDGRPLPRPHGPPVRALVPGLYFWKSAKWLTGVRFVARDEPGFWETRGYHNHADPWHEERYS
jgi:DMSO/TMAO reductase YedYZ molybdopterin-dependent catalytic subunit